MYSLFISTYNEKILIGLYKDNFLVAHRIKETKQSHSIYLIPLIVETLNEVAITTNSLNEIIVVNGPGSFTGVRLGITVAKTLAYTLNIPLKEISSIEAISNSILDTEKIIVISDSKGKYFGIFKNNKLIDNISYLKNSAFDTYISTLDIKIYENEEINMEKLSNLFNQIPTIKQHESKPIYIKEIEALSGKWL